MRQLFERIINWPLSVADAADKRERQRGAEDERKWRRAAYEAHQESLEFNKKQREAECKAKHECWGKVAVWMVLALIVGTIFETEIAVAVEHLFSDQNEDGEALLGLGFLVGLIWLCWKGVKWVKNA